LTAAAHEAAVVTPVGEVVQPSDIDLREMKLSDDKGTLPKRSRGIFGAGAERSSDVTAVVLPGPAQLHRHHRVRTG
jgi:hypothetical protein